MRKPSANRARRRGNPRPRPRPRPMEDVDEVLEVGTSVFDVDEVGIGEEAS